MSLIEKLRQICSSKRERVALLESLEMRTVLFGIDVSEGTIAQEREELEVIEALLRQMTTAPDK
jgi:hypothetical protein